MRYAIPGILLAGSATLLIGCNGRGQSGLGAGTAVAEVFASSEVSALEPTAMDVLNAAAGSDDPTTRRRGLASLGLLQLDQGALDAAEVTLAAAIADNRELRPFLRLRRATALEKLDRIQEAIIEVRSATEETTEPITLDEARITLVRLLARSGQKASLGGAFDKVMAITPGTFNDKALVDVADSLARAGHSDLATQLRFHLLSDYPRGRYTEKLYDHLSALEWSRSPFAALRFEQVLDLADRLSRVNRNSEAIDLIGRIRKQFPQRKDDPELKWTWASALFRSRQYREVVRIDSKPGEAHHISLLRLRAHAHWRSGNDELFVKLLEELLKRYPSHGEATTARILLGKYYLTDGDDVVRAADYLEKAIESGGNGDQGENIWTLAWIYIASNEQDKAVRTLERYLAVYPDADYTSNALFWLGRIHQSRGEKDRAASRYGELIRLYPYNYYSYRARAGLGDPALPPSDFPAAGKFPARDPEALVARDPRFDMVRELEAIERMPDATVRFEAIVESAPTDPTLALGLASRYSRIGRSLDAIRVLNRHFSDTIRHGGSAVPRTFWEILYPRQYWSAIESAGAEQRVDPYLVAAIIRQESGFDPSIVSGAGAVGLMQIMPREAARIARQGGIKGTISRSALFEPELNLRLGAAEIAQTIRTFDGNEILAAAAYNAGETPVKRWLTQTPINDMDFFIDAIPYSETRLYVKIVYRNRQEYERIYGSLPQDRTGLRGVAETSPRDR